jgi:hypothetical protein
MVYERECHFLVIIEIAPITHVSRIWTTDVTLGSVDVLKTESSNSKLTTQDVFESLSHPSEVRGTVGAARSESAGGTFSQSVDGVVGLIVHAGPEEVEVCSKLTDLKTPICASSFNEALFSLSTVRHCTYIQPR